MPAQNEDARALTYIFNVSGLCILEVMGLGLPMTPSKSDLRSSYKDSYTVAGSAVEVQ